MSNLSDIRVSNLSEVDVLFVEDSPDDVELAMRALKSDGIRAHWRRVDSEHDLRQAIGTLMPDAILSDFSMPGFDGLRALRIVREMTPDVPFIFLSGTIGEERAIEAIRAGATDYVLKNNIRRLGTAVKRALAESADRERSRRVEEERARLVEILEATSDFVAMASPQGEALYMNAAWRKLAGIAEPAVPGRPIRDLHPAAANELIHTEGLPASARDGTWQGETAVLAADGSEIPVSQVLIAHRGADGAIRFRSTIARDIRERKAYEARLQYLANYDSLTALPNRSLLGDRTSQAIAHAKRTDRSCALVVLGVDRLKLLNDSYGHAAGDALLKAIGERLALSVRGGDSAARIGADAFALLAGDVARPDDVLRISRSVRQAMAAPFTVDGHEIHATLSMGASMYPRDGEDFDVLLRNADAAANRVKEAGGNAFQFYAADMTRQALDRIELENALRSAIPQRQLELHYQPQIDLASGAVVGLEALMRWKHPTRGFVSPALFIPIAEESELIQELGHWALMEAVQRTAQWHGAGAWVRVAVNVSARQFRREGFAQAVAAALKLHGLKADSLELELTESALIDDRERALRVLEELKTLGVQIAVDDFGTGYSSLSYLSGLPVDCLKIDRAFVMRLDKGGRDAALAQAVVSMGHALGMRVLAEGVETAEQLRFLRSHDCDEGQGYLFAKPATPDALADLLRKGKVDV
jgi:diguanylate cyclase (GGDEF)-like protein/PAS domain S-box-containing protein